MEKNNKNFDIAIIVCTYNPQELLFRRTIKAIQALKVPENTKVEWRIIDNNSDNPLQTIQYIQQAIQNNPFQEASIIVEKQQGLSYSRIAGFQQTTAPVIVMFDDDNEPQADYLENVQILMQQYPFVGIWGPGEVNVDFLGKIPLKYEGHFRGTFQEKHLKFTEYALTDNSTTAHPLGTGMSVRRKVLDPYIEAFMNKQLSITDRIGKNLASSGDLQIVMMATQNHWAVGCSPLLKMSHIIPPHRTTYAYLKRLAYSTSHSVQIARAEFFPEMKKHIQLPSNKYFLFRYCKIYFTYLFNAQKHFAQLKTAAYLGNTIANYELLNKKISPILTFLAKWMNLH